MDCKGMRISIQSIKKSCKAFQVNKNGKLHYGHLPPNTIITMPWKVLGVDLTDSDTLKGKDDTVIDFMALTMIKSANSWFKIVEVPLVRNLKQLQLKVKSHLSLNL